MPKLNFSADKLECKDNKINSITGITNTATDEQYPSAKAVYDFVTGHNYVIEQGTCPTAGDGSKWQYRKWSDGYTECWFNHTYAIPMANLNKGAVGINVNYTPSQEELTQGIPSFNITKYKYEISSLGYPVSFKHTPLELQQCLISELALRIHFDVKLGCNTSYSSAPIHIVSLNLPGNYSKSNYFEYTRNIYVAGYVDN